ncbi:hypothetical protein F3J28_07075 [Enterobacter sp. Ap-1006]|uniref:hypothetical protein n=1 Tax=Enterobacter sp. Ap-1006 TaxID=2608345 RepID=UPI00142098FB|nr:hypothetical protein [Enterobacter sp. Ap-1006]NIF47525.1 hypothetical protein [Enterobacter sp. Ap-1006]
MDISRVQKALIIGSIFITSGCGYVMPAIDLTHGVLVRYAEKQQLNAPPPYTFDRVTWYALRNDLVHDCDRASIGEGSYFSWSGAPPCKDMTILDSMNQDPQKVMTVYFFYKGYRRPDNEVKAPRGQSELFLTELAASTAARNLGANPDIYSEYEQDRDTMGLANVDKATFDRGLAAFTAKQFEFRRRYQQLEAIVAEENKKLLQETKQAFAKSSPEGRINYEIVDLTGSAVNQVNAELRRLNFVRRNVNYSHSVDINNGKKTVTMGVDYIYTVNGRVLPDYFNPQTLVNSLEVEADKCQKYGTYASSAAAVADCIRPVTTAIRIWGAMARDKNISDQEWLSGSNGEIDGKINIRKWVRETGHNSGAF